ncbi:TadE/TadG family type IV pilus assembly protein [Neobacillus sp. LXY-4]|uniref:TadE/TadG family type IV pilus assembly protein n=1 Tax=Neobacillus sp. LXY-4 TaxID=3379826 RepID=UPI003EE13777
MMRSEKGQSLVEFALVLPVLLLLLFGIVDFGRIFHAYLTIDQAGREAARVASIGNDDGVIKNTAINYGESINLQGSQVTINPPSTRASGDEVEITIIYPIDFLTPVIGDIVSPLTLTDKTTMRVE